MPRIADNVLNCAIYLYPTKRDAADGERVGGSGFLVSRPSAHASYWHAYAITNSHVIREGNSPVVRLNTIDGKFAVMPLDLNEWVHHQDGDDLAAASIALTDVHRYSTIPQELFVTKEVIDKYGIGPGDETFAVGRFVNHEGRQRNLPSVRFGEIAQMADEPILHERGFLQESFLVEARSIPGYSGAPVFVRVMPIVPRPKPWPEDDRKSGISHAVPGAGPWLLGVDWSHLPLTLLVLDRNGDKTEYSVKANTGMMGVVPAWKVAELLDQDEFAQARAEADKEIAKKKAASPVVPDDSLGSDGNGAR